jgi:hypothetical protein
MLRNKVLLIFLPHTVAVLVFWWPRIWLCGSLFLRYTATSTRYDDFSLSDALPANSFDFVLLRYYIFTTNQRNSVKRQYSSTTWYKYQVPKLRFLSRVLNVMSKPRTSKIGLWFDVITINQSNRS